MTHQAELTEVVTMHRIHPTGKTSSPNPGDNPPRLLLRHQAKVGRSLGKQKRIDAATACRHWSGIGCVLLFLATVACCTLPAVVDLLMWGLVWAGGAWAVCGVWGWVEGRTM